MDANIHIHSPDLDREDGKAVCLEDGERWPCAAVVRAWGIPAVAGSEEARRYLVGLLDD